MLLRLSGCIPLVLALFVHSCSKGEPAAPPDSAAGVFAGHVSFTPPEGWLREDAVFGPDASVRFSRPPYAIVLQVLGGPGSRFPDPSSVFAMDSAPEQDMAGARGIGTVDAGGGKATLYLRTYTTFDKTHEGSGAAVPGREEFVVVEAGRRFLLISHFEDGAGENATVHRDWPVFLRGVRISKEF